MTIYLRRSEKTGNYYYSYYSEGETKLLDMQKIDAYTFWFCGGVHVHDCELNHDMTVKTKNELYEILKEKKGG